MAGIPPTGTMGRRGSLLGSTLGLGVSNLDDSTKFYDAVITAIGGPKGVALGDSIVWATKAGDTLLLIDIRAPATHGAEIFFSATSRDARHKVATALRGIQRFSKLKFDFHSSLPLQHKIRKFWVEFTDPDGNTVYVTYTQPGQ